MDAPAGERREVVGHLALILQLRHALGRGDELRQLVQRGFERDRVLLLERILVDGLNRAVRVVVAAHDARARDRDFFRLLLRLRRLLLRMGRLQADGRHCEGGRNGNR